MRDETRAAGEIRPPTAIQFTLDRPIDAGAAPFIVAASDGLFAAEGLTVTTDIANGSPEAIARVAAGASDFALVDINELIRFRDKPDAPPIKAVFVLFNQSPYAIVARKSRGIHALSDIEGKTLGVADGDFSIRLWPALAQQNGIKTASVKHEQIQRRRARADAVGGPGRRRDRVFISLGGQFAGSRRSRRRPRRCFAIADYGCEAYGFAVIVNPAFAAAKPEAVKGFLRAVIAGTHRGHQQSRTCGR